MGYRCFLCFPYFPCFPNVFVWPKKKQEALQILNQLGDVASLRKQSLVAHVLAKSPQARIHGFSPPFRGHLSTKQRLNVGQGNFEGFPLGR